LLYNLVISLYAFFVQVFYLFGHKKAKEFIAIRKVQSVHAFEKPHIWIHAASAGEGNQAIPLAIQLKEVLNCKITISFFSPSGYHFHKNTGCFDQVLNLPLDQPNLARKFIAQLQPSAAIFIRKELWLNTLSILKEKKIPAFLVNANPNNFMQNSLLKGYHTKCLHLFKQIYLTEKTENKLFKSFLVSNIVGDTKFENAFEFPYQKDAILDDFSASSTVVIVGSSWPQEEQLLSNFVNQQPHFDIKIVIAPHNVQRSRIEEIQSKFPNNTVLYSQYHNPSNAKVLILDVMGKLKNSYQYADIAIIGGGMGKGIHNILEAIACFKPIMIGPNYQKFSEANELVEQKLISTFKNRASFEEILTQFIQFPEKFASKKPQLIEYLQTKKSIAKSIATDILEHITP
jgi:3-deoxy-D-manno-octulosonic-acid transferase